MQNILGRMLSIELHKDRIQAVDAQLIRHMS